MPPKVTNPLQTKPPTKPYAYGGEKKTPLWPKILPWVFIILGLAAIGAMIAFDTSPKPLTCENNLRGSGSLNAFGTCTTN